MAPVAARAAALLLLCSLPAQTAPPSAELWADTLRVRAGDTLADIARAHGLGFVEMVAANPGLDPWRPPPGAMVALPSVHLAPAMAAPLVVNLGDMRLYRRRDDGGVDSFPIGIGRDGWELSAGAAATVIRKRRHPTWVPPASIRAEKPWLPASVPPGPDNPLGEYSLDLSTGLIRIHGTNRPDGVGRRVSHGCIRLYPEDIARLFPAVAVGTRVAIVDQPAKLAWAGGELWLEVHPSQGQADAVESRRPPPRRDEPRLEDRVLAAAGAEAARVDWALVAWAEDTRLGLPVRVTRPQAGSPTPLIAEKKKGPGE